MTQSAALFIILFISVLAAQPNDDTEIISTAISDSITAAISSNNTIKIDSSTISKTDENVQTVEEIELTDTTLKVDTSETIIAAESDTSGSSNKSVDNSSLLVDSSAMTENEQNSTGNTDTTRDSTETLALRKSLLAKLKNQSSYLYNHPTTADTLFNPYNINRINHSRDDYFTWNEVLRAQGEFTPIYYSPRHHLNRPLWRGYTLPLTYQHSGILTGPATAEQIFPNYEPIQVDNLTLDASGRLSATFFPQTWMSPQVFFIMENGLFEGNTLELRAMRNITRNISLGLFSSYRNLDRDEYSHEAGGMSGFYKGISALDTADISFKGRNPQSMNHTTSIHVKWQKKSKIDFLYKYQGLTNDIIFPYDSMPQPSDYDTVWFSRDGYNSDLRLLSNIPLAEKISLSFEGEINESVHRETPVTTKLIKRSSGRAAEQQYQGFGSMIDIAPLINDTISISASVNRSVTTHTNSAETKVLQSVLYAENRFHGSTVPIELFSKLGTTLLHTDGQNEVHPMINLSARLDRESLSVEGWAKLNIVPLTVPFDSTMIPVPKQLGDRYLGTGLRASITGKHLSLSSAYSYVTGVSNFSIASYWQNKITPYNNPGHVLSITPSFGEWKGISLSSSWSISDTKPFLKSTSRINFHAHKKGRSRHFYTSFYLNYWSERNPITYVGRSDWHRPVFDIGSKLTAEIKSFRLFFKIDNLLNRNNTYVPGYYMPGLIFRWGFAWTITG